MVNGHDSRQILNNVDCRPFLSLPSLTPCKISDAIDDNKISLGIFFDMSKAFDAVDHFVLITKLEIRGIHGFPLYDLKATLVKEDNLPISNLFSLRSN